MIDAILTFLVGAGSGFFLRGIFQSNYDRPSPDKDDPLEDRLYSYFFLLDNDPIGWRIKGQGSFFVGWVRYEHSSGKTISIYKNDGDVETDTISRLELGSEEKERLKKAVYRLQSLRTIDSTISGENK
jgi:hypothetical protein